MQVRKKCSEKKRNPLSYNDNYTVSIQSLSQSPRRERERYLLILLSLVFDILEFIHVVPSTCMHACQTDSFYDMFANTNNVCCCLLDPNMIK